MNFPHFAVYRVEQSCSTVILDHTAGLLVPCNSSNNTPECCVHTGNNSSKILDIFRMENNCNCSKDKSRNMGNNSYWGSSSNLFANGDSSTVCVDDHHDARAYCQSCCGVYGDECLGGVETAAFLNAAVASHDETAVSDVVRDAAVALYPL